MTAVYKSWTLPDLLVLKGIFSKIYFVFAGFHNSQQIFDLLVQDRWGINRSQMLEVHMQITVILLEYYTNILFDLDQVVKFIFIHIYIILTFISAIVVFN